MGLANATKHAVFEYPTYDYRGIHVLLVVVKGTFEVSGGRVGLAEAVNPIRPADELSDPDNGLSSVLWPSDISEPKPGADLIVNAVATSPRPTNVLDVAVHFRGKALPLRVHGERRFESRLGGLKISEAEPFTEMPIVYERAYGGCAEDWSKIEHANPAGVGVAGRRSDLEGKLAPQIEHPAWPHTSAADAHTPVGWGALSPFWAPRRNYFGDCTTAEYRSVIMPLCPSDFDRRYFMQAHPMLQFESPIEVGEPFAASGVTQDPVFSFSVPDFRIRLRAIYDNRKEEQLPPIDTLVVDPTAGRFELASRAVFPLGRSRCHRLREVHVDDLAL